MRKFSFLFFLSLLLFMNVRLLSQPDIQWQRAYGGSYFEGVHKINSTNDGGYIIAGFAYSGNGDVTGYHWALGARFADAWIVRTDANGTLLWQRCMGSSLHEYAADVRQTTDGGFIVAASSNAISNMQDVVGNHGGSDFWVIKLDAGGNTQWQKCLGGTADEFASSICQTSDGGYIVAGKSLSNSGDVSGQHGGNDCWIVKLNSSGDIQWQRSLGGSKEDIATAITPTTDGGYIFTGFTLSHDGDVVGHHGNSNPHQNNYDYWVVKLNSNGTIQWQKCLGGDKDDLSYSIQQTNDAGYIVTGYTLSNDGDVSGHHKGSKKGQVNADYWVVKLTSAGTIQWQKCLGGKLDDIAQSVQQSTDGGYIVGGTSFSNDGDVSGNHGVQDYWIVKLYSTGNIDWQKSLGGSLEEYCGAVIQKNDGGYIAVGKTSSNDGDVSGNHGASDVWVVSLAGEEARFSVNRTITGIKEKEISSFTIYPNPAQKQVNIYFPQKNLYEDVTISLINAVGQNVKQVSISSSLTTIPLTGLASGFYVYQIRSGRKNLKTGKLVIE